MTYYVINIAIEISKTELLRIMRRSLTALAVPKGNQAQKRDALFWAFFLYVVQFKFAFSTGKKSTDNDIC